MLLGAQINVIGLPFAVPYFAAVDQILRTGLEAGGVLGLLVAYNVAYALPFLALVAVRWGLRSRADAFFNRLTAGIDRVSAVVLPVLLVLVGLSLSLVQAFTGRRHELVSLCTALARNAPDALLVS